jgi:hypothetical protein
MNTNRISKQALGHKPLGRSILDAGRKSEETEYMYGV